MPSSNPFPGPKKTIINASDKITAKRDAVIYKELVNNVEDFGAIAQNKKINNVNYQDNFYTSDCSGSTQLAAAKNYDLLLSVTKGKRFNNPTLDGASTRSIPISQNGNHLRVTYDSSTKIPIYKLGFSNDNCKTPVIGDPWVIGSSGPEPSDTNCWPRTSCNKEAAVPSYIIDPSYTIFHTNCDSNVSPWKGDNICDVSFQEMPSYWRAANDQPLMGMSFPSKVTFGDQHPTPFSDQSFPYPPRPRPVSATDGGKELYDSWCKT